MRASYQSAHKTISKLPCKSLCVSSLPQRISLQQDRQGFRYPENKNQETKIKRQNLHSPNSIFQHFVELQSGVIKGKSWVVY